MWDSEVEPAPEAEPDLTAGATQGRQAECECPTDLPSVDSECQHTGQAAPEDCYYCGTHRLSSCAFPRSLISRTSGFDFE